MKFLLPYLKTMLCLTFFTFYLIKPITTIAQCQIDSTQTQVGLYPDTLPNGQVNELYSSDVTFIMQLDTLGLTINNYQIAGVAGLPIGLNWICSNNANGCNYNPAVNQYGCVNIYGTPLVAGSYQVTVAVIASIQVVGNQTVSFDVPITILPFQSNNAGFVMINAVGCAPLAVQFSNLIPGQQAYHWDFGNGIQSTLENPLPIVYDSAGTYLVTQVVTPLDTPQYFLTNVTINSIPNNYGGALDDPDLYFIIDNGLGNTVYDSRPARNGAFPPQSFAIPNLPLDSQNYTLHLWDEDGGLFGADDDLGLISFYGHGPSGNATATVNGASGTLNLDYNIFKTPANTIITTDTIVVNPLPLPPAITASSNTTFCNGDSVTLSINTGLSNQWYDLNGPLLNDTAAVITIFTSGSYFSTLYTPQGCEAISDTIIVNVNALPPVPTIFINGNELQCPLGGYTYQWTLNTMPIAGATNQNYFPTMSGTYTVQISDANNCANQSQGLFFTPTAIDLPATSLPFSVFPNPSNGWLYITCDLPPPLLVSNLLGNEIKVSLEPIGKNLFSMNLHHLPNGVYTLTNTATLQFQKIIVIH